MNSHIVDCLEHSRSPSAHTQTPARTACLVGLGRSPVIYSQVPCPGNVGQLTLTIRCPSATLMSWQAGILPMTGATNRSHSRRWVCACLRDQRSSAAMCRGMLFCPCYLRVDLRPSPGLCWREHPDGQGHPPAVGSRQDLRRAPRGPGIRPAAIDTPVRPDGDIPPQRSAPADPPTPDHTHAREGPPRAPGETLHHAGTLARPRAATHAVPTSHHPRPTHSKEKRLLSISKPRRTPTLCSLWRSTKLVARRAADRPVMRVRPGWLLEGGRLTGEQLLVPRRRRSWPASSAVSVGATPLGPPGQPSGSPPASSAMTWFVTRSCSTCASQSWPGAHRPHQPADQLRPP